MLRVLGGGGGRGKQSMFQVQCEVSCLNATNTACFLLSYVTAALVMGSSVRALAARGATESAVAANEVGDEALPPFLKRRLAGGLRECAFERPLKPLRLPPVTGKAATAPALVREALTAIAVQKAVRR